MTPYRHVLGYIDAECNARQEAWSFAPWQKCMILYRGILPMGGREHAREVVLVSNGGIQFLAANDDTYLYGIASGPHTDPEVGRETLGATAKGGTMLRISTVRNDRGDRAAGMNRPSQGRRKRLTGLTLLLVIIALAVVLLVPATAAAMPVQFFYVPFPEDQLLTMMDAINGAAVEPITSYITITAVADHTIVYYDQWENGYDIDIANTYNIWTTTNTGGTQIWGDGNLANGAPPAVLDNPGSTDADDVINAGTVILLTSDVYLSTRQSVESDFDGGDKIAATKTIAITRSSWAAVSRTLFAGCVEVFDTNNWGTDYRAPVGTNAANSYEMFSYAALSIMAGEDGATISVDANNDGDYLDANDLAGVALAEGESRLVTGIYVGAHVVSTRPVQVDIYTGDTGSNYESRDSALIPTSLWDSSYYTPVSTYNVSSQAGDERTTVWLYNPGSSAITLGYQRRDAVGALTTSTLTVNANSVNKQILENGSNGVGSHFYTVPSTVTANTSTSSTSTTNSLTFSHTTPAGSNRLLVVGVAIANDGATQCDVSRVTFAGVDLQYVGRVSAPSTGSTTADVRPQTEIWALVNPAASTAGNVVVTLTGSRPFAAGATTYTGVDVSAGLNSALGEYAGNSASSGTDISVTASTDVGDVLYDVVGTSRYSNQYPGAFTISGGQTRLWGDLRVRSGSNRLQGAAGTETAVSGSTTSSWTSNGYPWAISGVVIKAIPGSSFYAYSTTDSASATGATYNQAWDWSYTMIPESMLTTEALVGLGIGRDPDSTVNLTENGNPIWVTPVGNGDTPATVYYDFDADPTTGSMTDASGYRCDGALSLRELDQARIYDTIDRDQTGTLVYTLDPDVKLAVAWGQDPETASASAPGLDVGTSVPPMPEFTAGKDGLLYDDPSVPGMEGDLDGDGYISAGDIIEWPINVLNVSRLPVPDIIVEDVIPTDTTYVANSTYVCWDTDEDGLYESEVLLADNVVGTAFPLDEGGFNYGTAYGSLPVGGSFTVRFRVRIANPVSSGTIAILNDGSATAFDWTDPVGDRVFLRARLGDFVWWDENGDGIQDATEGGMPEVTVTLYDGEGHIVRNVDGTQMTSITDATGLYDFKGLLPGSYRVEFLLPPPTDLSYTEISPRNATSDDLDSDAYPSTDATNPCRTDMFTLGGAEWNRTVDCGVILIVNPESTLAVVDSFGAYVLGGDVVVNWETSSQIGTVGFYVEKKVGDEWVGVGKRFIPALFESPTGGSYSVVDGDASPGQSLTYRLVEVEKAGSRLVYGPYDVVAEAQLPDTEAASVLARGNTMARVPKMAMTTAQHPWKPWISPVEPRNATQMKIEVVETGLYRIDASDLVEKLHVTPEIAQNLIRTKGVKLTNRGSTVAYLQAADNSSLYFFGEAIDSIYTSANVYWLSLQKGTIMSAGSRIVPSGVSANDFVDSVHVEQNLFSYTDGFHDPEADFWLWNYLFAGDAGYDSQTIDVDAPGAIEGQTLTVSLMGMTTMPRVNEHHAEVRLNGTLLGDTWWSGMAAHTAEFAIPAGVLLAGANQVDITAVLDADDGFSVVAIDSIDLRYQRSATAVDDRLLVNAAAKGPMVVAGLSSTDVWVFDLANPLTPTLARIGSSGGDPSGAWVKFGAMADTRYYVTTPGAALRPVAITAVEDAPFSKAGLPEIDYVVITHPALLLQATVLADYRAGQGLKTMVVTTAQIYDYFNYGIVDPHAIQAFTTYALKRPSTAPKFLVLVGDGSFDYKDYQGFGDSLVPPLMVDTPEGLAPSDNLLADVTGNDGVPEFAIGRIPAVSDADVANAYLKIVAYEAAEKGAWSRSVLVAADNEDPDAGDFATDSDAVAALLPASFAVTKAYLDDLDLLTARTTLLSNFVDTLWINYIGHSGIDNWAHEGLLTAADTPGMALSARLPFVTALTCVAGQFALPGADCLSEALVKQAGSGAIAVLSPTAKEENDQSVRLGELFVSTMFDPPRGTTLGKAVRSSLQKGAAAGLPKSLLATYNLLGDPAVTVKW